MTSLNISAPAQRYNLTYSRRLFYLEILFFSWLLLCLFLLIPGLWLWPVILLFSLLCLRFFTRQSVIHQYAAPCAIELRVKPSRLICYHQQQETCFSEQQVSLKISRWFVLVKFRHDSQQFDRLLLADNFDNPAQYSHFRRQLLEIFDVS